MNIIKVKNQNQFPFLTQLLQLTRLSLTPYVTNAATSKPNVRIQLIVSAFETSFRLPREHGMKANLTPEL